MPRLQDHLRRTFLAGIFAAVPVAVTAFIIYYVDAKTRVITHAIFGREWPFVGILIAIVAIYLCGLVATSLFGKLILKLIDASLSRVPMLKPFYVAWKQVALTPGGSEGVFSRVVLVSADESGSSQAVGFCSGQPLQGGDGSTYCVFVPAAPNPMNGRLFFVHRDRCRFLDVSAEDAFKMILSTGNYVPSAISLTTTQPP
jgi:uncharacterized membrane protein